MSCMKATRLLALTSLTSSIRRLVSLYFMLTLSDSLPAFSITMPFAPLVSRLTLPAAALPEAIIMPCAL